MQCREGEKCWHAIGVHQQMLKRQNGKKSSRKHSAKHLHSCRPGTLFLSSAYTIHLTKT